MNSNQTAVAAESVSCLGARAVVVYTYLSLVENPFTIQPNNRKNA